MPGPSEALEAWLADGSAVRGGPLARALPADPEPARIPAPSRRRRRGAPTRAAGELHDRHARAEPVATAIRRRPPSRRPTLERAAEQLEAAAGEPDREVEALRRTIGNLARGDRQAHVEADLDERRQELTVESLLREIDTQREVLRERNRLLARERAHLRRITESMPYRVYRRLRAPARGPTVRGDRLARVRHAQTQARSAQRAQHPAGADASASSSTTAASEAGPGGVVIGFGCAIHSEDKYRALRAARDRAGPRPAGAADRASRANLPRSAPTTSSWTSAAADPRIEALALIHEDTEIRDDRFEERVRWALADPAVAIVGTIGSVGVQGIDWWVHDYGVGSSILEPIDAAELYETALLGGAEMSGSGSSGEVDMVDGYLLVFSRWAISELRFDER